MVYCCGTEDACDTERTLNNAGKYCIGHKRAIQRPSKLQLLTLLASNNQADWQQAVSMWMGRMILSRFSLQARGGAGGPAVSRVVELESRIAGKAAVWGGMHCSN